MNETTGIGALPKYVQISETLIRQIAAGHLVNGARLPPERDMAAGLGISVGTLRKSLAELTAKGLLHRVQGSGNYVRHQPDTASIYAFFRLERPGGGGLPSADLLGVDRMAKPQDAPPFGPSAEGHRIRRIRRLDGTVVALEEIWLDASRAKRILAMDLSQSLYHFYRGRLGLAIVRVEDRVGTAQVPDWAPATFHLRPGQFSGYIDRVSHATDATPAEFSRTWFDSDRAQYVSRMGRG